jgi:hypothetical protein
VSWIHLDSTENRVRQIRAASIRAVERDGSVLIIGHGQRPASQQEFASQIPGAVTVEAVDLRDVVDFSRDLDFTRPDALARVVSFAGAVMTNVGAADLMRRVEALERGTARREATDAEQAALRLKASPSPSAAVGLLSELSRQGGVRTHRPAVLRAGITALQSCDGAEGNSFYDTAIRAREQNRMLGRPLPKRAVGSTLLLKGLEADTSVILNASDLDARNLYVAMTRGSKRLVVCSDGLLVESTSLALTCECGGTLSAIGLWRPSDWRLTTQPSPGTGPGGLPRARHGGYLFRHIDPMAGRGARAACRRLRARRPDLGGFPGAARRDASQVHGIRPVANRVWVVAPEPTWAGSI